MSTCDIVIVGGGLSGCAMAAALADGRRRIVVLEARTGKNPRFNGELIHPTGVDVLDKRGFLDALHAAGGSDVRGFACLAPGRKTGQETVLPYAEIPGSRPLGFAIDHHDLVDTIRKIVVALPGVELRQGERVTSVIRDQERVVGVTTTSGPIHAALVIGCDGRHSKLRTLLGFEERATLLSFSAAVLLADCELPRPGFGHIFLDGWGPVLAYPISKSDARAIFDLPADMDRGTEAVIRNIREGYLPTLPLGVRISVARALDAGEVEIAANYSIRTDECQVPGATLVGDACGCSHPLTATGMTVALTDTRLLSEALAGVDLRGPDAANQIDRALARYQLGRYRYVRAREILADALYEVFRGIDDGTRAIREGIFRYWNASLGSRARSMALLSGHESRLPIFLREYLTVVARSTSSVLRGQVNEPTIAGRVRSMVGLGKKSLEKLGLVARGVREGRFVSRYDRIGHGYAHTRQEEPRLYARIAEALGQSRTVVNVGAGAGSYEPRDRHVIAIEPSEVMAAQRPRTLAPAIRATAESLPLRDHSVDAAMAVLSLHHWDEAQERGVRELRRVASGPVAALDRRIFPRSEQLAAWLGGSTRVEVIPIPRDTCDWTLMSFWAHPERVLDAGARNATSGFARMEPAVVERVVAAVGRDLDDGTWDTRYGHLRALDAYDAGLRLVVNHP